ncbi:MAG: hypothetical protein Q4B67_02295 [Eubacteriales bacterium]|nr:hypothetical protein [Eubacteriales bacterium]
MNNKFRVTCVFLALAAVLMMYNYLINSSHYTATLSLNYSEAAQGLNPNGTRFNSYEIMSNEVLEDAIRLSGLQGQITADELAEYLSVSPVDTGNAAGDDEYFSTTYTIYFEPDFTKLGTVDSIYILKNICFAYRDYYMNKYGDNRSLLKSCISEDKDKEPYIRINEIETVVNQIKRYLNSRLKENKTFVDPETGYSFKEIEKELANLENYDIPNTRAFIIEEGVAKNRRIFRQTLQYKNKIETIARDRHLGRYNADLGGIAKYEAAMSSVVMIPTKDWTNDFYMSRTRTGMDFMAKSADYEADEVASYNKEIINTQYVIDRVQIMRSTQEDLERAQEMIATLEASVNSLCARFSILDKAYIEYKTKNYLDFIFNYKSFLEKIDILNVALWMFGFAALWFILMMILPGRKETVENEEI